MADWRDRAACAGLARVMDPPNPTPKAYETALTVCRRCPVEGDCLAFALTLDPDPDGIIGGTTPEERAEQRRRRRAAQRPPRPRRIDHRVIRAAERRTRFAVLIRAGYTVAAASREVGVSARTGDRYKALLRQLEESTR